MTGSANDMIRNGLLSAMSSETMSALRPHLHPMTLPVMQVLVEAGEPTEHVYFIEDGLASIVATSREGESLDVGHLGREGLSGSHVLLSTGTTPMRTFMQADGFGFRIPVTALLQLVQADLALRGLLMRYVHSRELQLAYCALASGRYKIRARLARQLLMCHDRLVGNNLPLTHELLGIMLGVRRSGITIELQNMEALGIIKATRGLIKILKRAGLEEMAEGSYGIPESQYLRLLAEANMPISQGVERVRPNPPAAPFWRPALPEGSVS